MTETHRLFISARILLVMIILIPLTTIAPEYLYSNLTAVATARGAILLDVFSLTEGRAWATRACRLGVISESVARLNAIVAIKLHQPDKAISLLCESTDELPGDSLMGYWAGVAYEEMGLRDHATQALLRAGATNIATAQARALVAARDLSGASNEFDRILSVYPNLPEALSGKGDIALQRGEWRSAAAHFRLVLDQNPTDVLSLVGLAVALSHLENDNNFSLSLIEKAIAFQPQCQWCYLSLAEMHARAGRSELAHAAYENAHRLKGR